MLLIDYLNQLRARATKIGASPIAKHSGLDYNTVNNFIAGRNPTERTMLAVELAVTELEKNHG